MKLFLRVDVVVDLLVLVLRNEPKKEKKKMFNVSVEM